MKFFAILLLFLLIAAGIAGYILYAPYGPSSETFVDIAPGTGASAIAAQLERHGIIRSRYGFSFLRFTRGGTLKAGEYRFDHPAPVGDVYERLVQGYVYTRALVIPEGYNIFDIASAVESAGLGTRGEFLMAARQHPELIAGLLPPGSHPESLEGYLFPDTYRFSRNVTALQMLTAMVHRFRQASAQLGLTREDIVPTVVMASLIEKEVGQESERPLVAGVFVNRLARSMPLATDPTVIYAALLEDRWRGTIYASDLQSPNPYNTYKHTGLPPGPICNPGMAALHAALHPAHTDYLYFVSDAAGHTRFSTDLKEHAQQVQAYRQATKH
ncbi:MAG: endolytic transglycosylase MltG [Edaphobacter sp.]